MAIWVPSVANQAKETETSDTRGSGRGYSSISPVENKDEVSRRRVNNEDDLELSVIESAAISEDIILEELKVLLALVSFLLFTNIIIFLSISFSSS